MVLAQLTEVRFEKCIVVCLANRPLPWPVGTWGVWTCWVFASVMVYVRLPSDLRMAPRNQSAGMGKGGTQDHRPAMDGIVTNVMQRSCLDRGCGWWRDDDTPYLNRRVWA
jgi:hypothetical protein